MANIAAVHIRGFQSHTESDFILGPGLNVITGPSDAGKTAIIRAVRWVAFNEPTGEAYLNQSVGETEVILRLDNGMVISKHRKRGKTSYIIQPSEEQEGTVYEKAEVPEEVKIALGIVKQSFGDFETSLNFAFQLEAPFLISETASAGAKVLGKLAGTEAVDIAVKLVNKDTVAARNERAQASRDMERINGSLLAYGGIDEAKEQLDLVERLVEALETDHHIAENLKELRNRHEVYTAQLQSFTEVLDRLAIVPTLEEDLKNIEKAQKRYDQLLELYRQSFSLETRLADINRQLERHQGTIEAAAVLSGMDASVERLTVFTSLAKDHELYTLRSAGLEEQLLSLLYVGLVDIDQIASDSERVETLAALVKQYNDLMQLQEAYENRLERLQDTQEAESLLNGLEAKYGRLVTFYELRSDYGVKASRNSNATYQLQVIEKQIEAARKEEAAAWEAAGGLCPLCEQPLVGGHSH